MKSWAQWPTSLPVSGYAVHLQDVSKQYGKDAQSVVALDRVSMGIAQGTFTAVMGPSGSGRSTFLHCAAGLDRPSSGAVYLGATNLAELREARLTKLRRSRMGFVFQSFNLLPSLTVEQNITLPLRLDGKPANQGWLEHVVGQVGIADKLGQFPTQLSGGRSARCSGLKHSSFL
ncbi:ATP-binding cassette domain-containing protein [Streptomyces sp. NPDC006540]|uniref:ABC transporter ATP-binding protein n=1 Tax=Streptomyces sp. NPDC006540 TaxID=3155353 RepID=UPI0033A29358